MVDKILEKSIRKFVKWLHNKGIGLCWEEDYYGAFTDRKTNDIIKEFLEGHHNEY